MAQKFNVKQIDVDKANRIGEYDLIQQFRRFNKSVKEIKGNPNVGLKYPYTVHDHDHQFTLIYPLEGSIDMIDFSVTQTLPLLLAFGDEGVAFRIGIDHYFVRKNSSATHAHLQDIYDHLSLDGYATAGSAERMGFDCVKSHFNYVEGSPDVSVKVTDGPHRNGAVSLDILANNGIVWLQSNPFLTLPSMWRTRFIDVDYLMGNAKVHQEIMPHKI